MKTYLLTYFFRLIFSQSLIFIYYVNNTNFLINKIETVLIYEQQIILQTLTRSFDSVHRDKTSKLKKDAEGIDIQGVRKPQLPLIVFIFQKPYKVE